MNLKKLDDEFCICKTDGSEELAACKTLFFAKTEREYSLVCPLRDAPKNAITVDAGWKGFFIDDKLDFSLIGILAKITTILAENDVGVFAVSTFDTDYIFVKAENFTKALNALSENGYTVFE